MSKLKAFADNKFCVTDVLKTLNLLFIGQKTLWKKEKMLVTSIFSFSTIFLNCIFLRGIKPHHGVIKDKSLFMAKKCIHCVDENQASYIY